MVGARCRRGGFCASGWWLRGRGRRRGFDSGCAGFVRFWRGVGPLLGKVVGEVEGKCGFGGVA